MLPGILFTNIAKGRVEREGKCGFVLNKHNINRTLYISLHFCVTFTYIPSV